VLFLRHILSQSSDFQDLMWATRFALCPLLLLLVWILFAMVSALDRTRRLTAAACAVLASVVCVVRFLSEDASGLTFLDPVFWMCLFLLCAALYWLRPASVICLAAAVCVVLRQTVLSGTPEGDLIGLWSQVVFFLSVTVSFGVLTVMEKGLPGQPDEPSDHSDEKAPLRRIPARNQ